MYFPDVNSVRTLSEDYNVVPITTEFHADMETPISIFRRLEDDGCCFLLESVEGGEKWARYSFVGRNPFLTFESCNKKSVIKFRDGRCNEIEGNPVLALKSLMEKFKGPDIKGIPRFNGGAVGFFGYDLVRYYEDLPDTPDDDMDIPECHFMMVDEVIVFDHLKQKIQIIVNAHTDKNIERAYNTAVQRINDIYREIQCSGWKLNQSIETEVKKGKEELRVESSMSQEEFFTKVDRAKKYIRDGDVFQLVLSQRLCVQTDAQPLNVYRILRTINPSPYMYYLKFNNYSIVGASPEMLVRVEGSSVETCPIAGTRRRGRTDDEDNLLQKELLSDEKELAEHTMLVDLARNDIGRVCSFGSVSIKDFMHVEMYSHVMHIVTNVCGELKKDKTAFDALVSVMPAGTLSGAPKIRAMEIIDELETVKRGAYGGAIGYLSFNGNLDSCITIRTVVFKDNKAYIQAGAGIVADSAADKEYEESLNKAKALLSAIEQAGEI